MVEGLSKTENCTVPVAPVFDTLLNEIVHTYEYTVGVYIPLVYILISYDLLKVSLVRSTDH